MKKEEIVQLLKDQTNEITEMFDIRTRHMEGVVEKSFKEVKDQAWMLAEDYQDRLSTTIEYVDGRIDGLENNLGMRVDKVENTLELIKSDVVDIKFELNFQQQNL